MAGCAWIMIPDAVLRVITAPLAVAMLGLLAGAFDSVDWFGDGEAEAPAVEGLRRVEALERLLFELNPTAAATMATNATAEALAPRTVSRRFLECTLAMTLLKAVSRSAWLRDGSIAWWGDCSDSSISIKRRKMAIVRSAVREMKRFLSTVPQRSVPAAHGGV